jgi:acetylornithine deacetylase
LIIVGHLKQTLMAETTVIKVGGGILLDPAATRRLCEEVAKLSDEQEVVIVHGGGPQATELAARMGHQPKIVQGRRVTSDLDLELVLSTVCGVVNSQLVAALSLAGVKSVGITGASSGLVSASKRPPWTIDGDVVDFGHVGDIESIDPAPVQTLTAGGFVPVIATVGTTTDGALLNINADTTAVQIAIALNASRLLVVTTAGGLIKDGNVVATCDEVQINEGVADGWITDGMHVKLATALDAAESGIEHVAIVNTDSLMSPDGGTRILAVSSFITTQSKPHTLDGASRAPIKILKSLIRFPSVTGDEELIADWVEAWASSAGLETRRFENSVYCWIGNGDDCLLLNSHLDVVPPSSDHPFDPFDPVQKDGLIYGRGSVDAKASGAAMLSTIAQLAAQGWAPEDGKLLVALTECEEGTGKHNGLQRLLPHLPAFSGAIVGEPTGLQPCVSQKGLLILKATATGRSAHAARAGLGENAIEKAARDVTVLQNLSLDRIHPDLGTTSVAVTTISGGSARNVIPEECTFFIDIRTTPAYTHDEIIAQIDDMIESRIEVHSGRYVPATTPKESRIEHAVMAAIPESRSFGSPTVSDWAFLGDTPAIKLGPGDSKLSHTGNEHIQTEQVLQAVEVYTSIARTFFEESKLEQPSPRVIEEAI